LIGLLLTLEVKKKMAQCEQCLKLLKENEKLRQELESKAVEPKKNFPEFNALSRNERGIFRLFEPRKRKTPVTLPQHGDDGASS